MATAFETELRFIPPDPRLHQKLHRETNEAVSGAGYRVHRVRHTVQYLRHPCVAERWDVFFGPRWIGDEPNLYWAMKSADRHYFTGDSA